MLVILSSSHAEGDCGAFLETALFGPHCSYPGDAGLLCSLKQAKNTLGVSVLCSLGIELFSPGMVVADRW